MKLRIRDKQNICRGTFYITESRGLIGLRFPIYKPIYEEFKQCINKFLKEHGLFIISDKHTNTAHYNLKRNHQKTLNGFDIYKITRKNQEIGFELLK